jgi:predicted aminopeptidase
MNRVPLSKLKLHCQKIPGFAQFSMFLQSIAGRPSTGGGSSKKGRCLQKVLFAGILAAVVLGVSGCQTLTFYAQAIKGQCQLFTQEQRIDKLLANPQTPAKLRARFELLRELRGFAAHALRLPVDGHYAKYVDVHRPFVVWNVEAAPEFSLQPKSWWYPLLGSLEYRGYFSERGAGDYGAILKKRGFDIYIGGVTAYSTLGWFKDPMLNTFIFQPDADLAETIFHELGHQRVFARGDTDFNEAFATTVGQEGARRWLRSQSDTAAYEKYQAGLQRNTQFVHLIMETRQRLETLYGDQHTDEGRVKATPKNRGVSPELLRQEKQKLFARLHQEYEQLKAEWGSDKGYDEWFALEVNNAQLNSVAAYYDFVPGFERLLASNGGDLEQFYHAAKRLSKLPKKQRHQELSN